MSPNWDYKVTRRIEMNCLLCGNHTEDEYKLDGKRVYLCHVCQNWAARSSIVANSVLRNVEQKLQNKLQPKLEHNEHENQELTLMKN